MLEKMSPQVFKEMQSEDENVKHEAQAKMREAMTPINTDEFAKRAVAKLKACLDHLLADPRVNGNVGVLGFCFGGSYAFHLAVGDARIKAVVPFYGSAPEPLESIASIKSPILAFYGEEDKRLIEKLPALEAAMKQYGRDFSYMRYPARGPRLLQRYAAECLQRRRGARRVGEVARLLAYASRHPIVMNELARTTAITLENGLKMPILGLGVWQMGNGDETVNAVRWALEAGYRHIDTAALYGNEESVGNAVRGSGIAREELFVTTKLWPTDYLNPQKGFDASMKRLGLDYVDLYLIHWPIPLMTKSVWHGMEKIYASGRAKAIGISNYGIKNIDDLLSYATVAPMVNQVKFSPFDYDAELLEYCRSKKIALEAYSPLTPRQEAWK